MLTLEGAAGAGLGAGAGLVDTGGRGATGKETNNKRACPHVCEVRE